MYMVHQSNNKQTTNFKQTKSFSNKINGSVNIAATSCNKPRTSSLLQQIFMNKFSSKNPSRLDYDKRSKSKAECRMHKKSSTAVQQMGTQTMEQ